MNQCEIALFLAFYVYFLNVATANNAQRVILLSYIMQIQALQLQILMLNKWQRRHCSRRLPRFWVLPRPNQSWFGMHYFHPSIPGDYFRQQLWLNRETFTMLLNILRPWLIRQNT